MLPPFTSPEIVSHRTILGMRVVKRRHSCPMGQVHPLTPRSTPVSFFNKVFLLLFFVALQGMWELSSLTRDRTHIPCSESTES